MPAALTERPPAPAAPCPPRKRWTRAECERAESAGIFHQQRLELIEGELIDKMGKNRPHVGTATLLMSWLIRVFGDRFVNTEAPIDVAPEDNPTNEPVPDMVVLDRKYVESAGYWSRNPQPRDLALVVEIADTSLAFDLTVKAPLYARAGVAEYWVLDIVGRRLLVHRQPEGGQYAAVTSYNQDESVTSLAAPDSSLAIRSLFPE
jgi:Uma2 family endonuclease